MGTAQARVRFKSFPEASTTLRGSTKAEGNKFEKIDTSRDSKLEETKQLRPRRKMKSSVLLHARAQLLHTFTFPLPVTFLACFAQRSRYCAQGCVYWHTLHGYGTGKLFQSGRSIFMRISFAFPRALHGCFFWCAPWLRLVRNEFEFVLINLERLAALLRHA